jgi:hypothetical protein
MDAAEQCAGGMLRLRSDDREATVTAALSMTEGVEDLPPMSRGFLEIPRQGWGNRGGDGESGFPLSQQGELGHPQGPSTTLAFARFGRDDSFVRVK